MSDIEMTKKKLNEISIEMERSLKTDLNFDIRMAS